MAEGEYPRKAISTTSHRSLNFRDLHSCIFYEHSAALRMFADLATASSIMTVSIEHNIVAEVIQIVAATSYIITSFGMSAS